MSAVTLEHFTKSALIVPDDELPGLPFAKPGSAALTVSQPGPLLKEQVKHGGVQLPAPNTQIIDAGNDKLAGSLHSESLSADQVQQIANDLVALGAKAVFLSPDDFEVELGLLLDKIKGSRTQVKLAEIERARTLNLDDMQKNTKAMAESLKAATQSQKSGLAAKIFGWFSAIASIIVGAVMCATGVGAVAGALMIAGGVMGVVSNALQQAAQDGRISKEVMAVLGPVLLAVEIAIAVVSVAVTFGGAMIGAIAKLGAKVGGSVARVTADASAKVAAWSAKAVEVTSKSLLHGAKFGVEVAQFSLSVANGATQAVNQGFQANAGFKEADVTQNRAELDALQAVMDRLKGELSKMVEAFAQIMELIAQMLSAKSQSLHSLSTRASTI